MEDDKVQDNFGKPIQDGFCKAKRKVALTITTVSGVCVARGALRPGWGRGAPHAQLWRRVQRRAGVAWVEGPGLEANVRQGGVDLGLVGAPGIWNDVWARGGGWERAYVSAITTVVQTEIVKKLKGRKTSKSIVKHSLQKHIGIKAKILHEQQWRSTLLWWAQLFMTSLSQDTRKLFSIFLLVSDANNTSDTHSFV